MSEINISEVTDGTVAGSGYFDELMRAVTVHLDTQWVLNRLKGSDYATVYLGLTQSVLQQSLAFALGKQQADKQAELIAAQAAEVVAGGVRTDTQLADSLLTTAEQRLEIQEKVDLLQTQDSELLLNGTKDRLIKDEQVIELQEKVDLLQSQDLDVTAKTGIATAQSTQDLLNKQEQVTASITDTDNKTDSVTADVTLKGIQGNVATEQSTKDLLVKAEQIDTAIAQQGLINNQAATEIKQALDVTKLP